MYYELTMWFVYVLICSDNSLYTGITNDLEKRWTTHINGKGAQYTKSHKPVKIAYSEPFEKKGNALKREAEIKKMKRSDKIKLLKLTV